MTGFVGGVVTGLVHDVEELVAAIGNLGQTLAKMANDIAHGRWDQVGKDADQMLLDINDICRSLSAILTTLTPLLQLIPGIGEIVDFLDVVMLAASILMVVTDVGMMIDGGTAKDPLNGQQENLSQVGSGNLAMDSVGLVFSLLPGGGGVTDDAVDDTATDALKDWQKSVSGDDLESALGDVARDAPDDMNDVAAMGEYRDAVESQMDVIAFHDVAADSKFSDITDYRQMLQDSATRADAEEFVNPTVFNKFGLKISLVQYRDIASIVTPAEHGAMLGYDANQLATNPSDDADLSAANDGFGAIKDGVLP